MLVTQIPKLPRGLLLAFSLAYIILSIWLGIVAYRAASSSSEIWALATGLSLPAIVAAAFRFPPGEDDAKVHVDFTKDEESSDTARGAVEIESKLVKGAVETKSKPVRTAGSPETGWTCTKRSFPTMFESATYRILGTASLSSLLLPIPRYAYSIMATDSL